LTVLGVGIAGRVKAKEIQALNDNTVITTSLNIMIAAGVFVAVIGFLGCWGAIKNQKFLLICYTALVVLVFIMQIAAGAYAYTKKDKVIASISKTMKKEVLENYGSANNAAQKALDDAVDLLQRTLKCCGVSNATDYTKNKKWNDANPSKVPASCCGEKGKSCDAANAYKAGCESKVKTYIKDHMWQIGGAAIGIAVVQVLGVVISIVLIRDIEHTSLA